jgi:hypothetical protein
MLAIAVANPYLKAAGAIGREDDLFTIGDTGEESNA